MSLFKKMFGARGSPAAAGPSPAEAEAVRIQDCVARAAELLAADPILSEDEISKLLTIEGFSRALAERAMAFVRIAFGRRYLSKDPPAYSPGYEIRDFDSARSEAGILGLDRVFQAAVQEAERFAKERDGALFLRVARRSSELEAIAQLTANGSRPADHLLLEPVFFRIPLDQI